MCYLNILNHVHEYCYEHFELSNNLNEHYAFGQNEHFELSNNLNEHYALGQNERLYSL